MKNFNSKIYYNILIKINFAVSKIEYLSYLKITKDIKNVHCILKLKFFILIFLTRGYVLDLNFLKFSFRK